MCLRLLVLKRIINKRNFSLLNKGKHKYQHQHHECIKQYSAPAVCGKKVTYLRNRIHKLLH